MSESERGRGRERNGYSDMCISNPRFVCAIIRERERENERDVTTVSNSTLCTAGYGQRERTREKEREGSKHSNDIHQDSLCQAIVGETQREKQRMREIDTWIFQRF